MSGESPDVVLYDNNSNPLAVQNASAIPASTPALLMAGSDGTNSRYILVDGSSRQIIAGAGTAGTPAGGVISVQGVAGGTAIPVSGTVTATNASVSTTATTPPGSATYIGGSVTTAAPTYVTATMNALSLTTGGLLRIDGSGVTQPVSGTVTANAGTGNFNVIGTGTAGTAATGVVTVQGIAGGVAQPVSGTVAATQSGTWTTTVTQATAANLNATVVASGNFNNASVSTPAAAPPASATYVGGSVTTAAPTYTTGQMDPLSLTTAGALRIDGSAVTQPVSGTVTANAGTGNFTVVQATAANLRAQTASEFTTAAATGTIATLMGGAVTTAAPGYTTGQMDPLSLTTTGLLRVDGSGVTQPVSGTVTANAGTGTFTVGGTVTANQGTANTLANAWSTKITDATNGPAAVKAASTAAVATDPALVVAISPNNSLTIATADVTATGALGALNAAVQLTLAGHSTAGFQLAAGTLIGTIVAETSFDGGTTWTSTFMDTGNKVSTIVFGVANTATAATVVGVGGSGLVRIRVSAYTSGTANITIRASVINDPSVVYAGQPNAIVQPPTSAQIAGWDGTTLRVPAVKAASTAAVAADQSLVVTLSPNSTGPVSLASDTVSTGTITATAQTAVITLSTGWSSVSWQFTGTWTGTINFEKSIDGANWTTMSFYDATASNAVNSVTANGIYFSSAGAIESIRIRSSGTWTGTLTWTNARSFGEKAVTVQDAIPSGTNTIGYVNPDTTATGALGALAATVTVNCSGLQTVGVQIAAGTLAGTILPEFSWDGGTTYSPGYFIGPASLGAVATLVSTNPNPAQGKMIAVIGGAGLVRVRVSAYTSGTCNVTLRASGVIAEFVGLAGAQAGAANPPMTLQVGGTDGTNLHALSTIAINGDNALQIQEDDPLTASSYPDQGNYVTTGSSASTYDAFGNLQVRGTVLTDEGSLRDDFTGTALTTAITGNLTWTNGSVTVTGTNLQTQIRTGQYIKKTADAETLYVQVASIDTATSLTLVTAYTGTSAAAASVVSNWQTVTPTSGTGAITVATSIMTMGCGTTANGTGSIRSLGDYLPYSLQFYAEVSQRIANQTLYMGMQDVVGITPNQQATVQFSGTVNTTCNFVTCFANTTADTQTTAVTIPNGGTTATYHAYKIDLSANQATLSIDGVIVATNTIHLPSPYTDLFITAGVVNGAVAPASNTNFLIDYIFFENLDRIQVDQDFPGEPLPVLTQQSYGVNNQTITITLNSLTNTSQRQSTAVNNSFTEFRDALVQIIVTTAAAAVSATGITNVYAYASSNGGTTYGDTATGTDGAVTLTSPPNLKLIGTINTVANATTYDSNPMSVAAVFGGKLPQFWGIVVENKSGATFNATAGNFKAFYQGVTG